VQQGFLMRDNMVALQNWAAFYPYRPRTPVHADPRAWWKYAYTCIA
jgi:Vacuolar sorting-associated protein 13, N-terminal